MCRWFAYISNSEPCLLEDVLIRPAHAITKQVHDHYLPYLTHYEPDADTKATEREIAMRNRLFNTDGLVRAIPVLNDRSHLITRPRAWHGMSESSLIPGWPISCLCRYTTARSEFTDSEGPRPVQYRIVREPITDPVFKSVCAQTSSLAVFAHIRAASEFAVVSEFNNHPFVFDGAQTSAGRYAFMHNGEVAHFASIRREVLAHVSEDAEQRIKGSTDSEHLAALFFTYLAGEKGAAAWDASHSLEEVKAALEKAVTTVISVQHQTLPKKGIEFNASSLNVAVTDGTQLLAIRFRNHPTEHPPSLYFSTRAGVTLNRKYPGHPDGASPSILANIRAAEEHGEHVIVASEPTTYQKGDWQLVPKNHCLMVGSDMQVDCVPFNVDATS
ncbi:N-terminal nucleophile aminohydrolase [Punctularia strigosozonata HHB-11173 SS5]|uniref:N-terminal nucleophile aminohydrolase n=1 Tax=Punctularia strigosozonata (strain HHB-11173) TaxID=741275 RepID=UPI0004417299|nr:N-terminal nucleophile aminohydrolase [Punctularia strigosozonata HHB-11173 SS5]EIN05716.1 N-terminal nucleophile aminohydrolase [Punctularia strigosozonata HHB-11173 SS5]